jgi:hypothetical protein
MLLGVLALSHREAKRFILHKNVCFHSTTVRCYLSQEHRHDIKRRKALSKAENYFKKLNIPTSTSHADSCVDLPISTSHLALAVGDDYLSSECGTPDVSSDTDTELEGDFALLDSMPPPTDQIQRENMMGTLSAQ